MKAFIAALAVGALALLGGASAASSAQPSLQHYMIGFGHSPNAADAALVKSHGGTVRQSFQSIGVLAVDMPSDQVNDVKQGCWRELRRGGSGTDAAHASATTC